MSAPPYDDAAAFARWLLQRVIADARGDHFEKLDVAPDGRFWLGRLSPEEKTRNSSLGERGERVDPCEVGLRIGLPRIDGRNVTCRARVVTWKLEAKRDKDNRHPSWVKLRPIDLELSCPTPTVVGKITRAGQRELGQALEMAGAPGLSAEIQIELEAGMAGPELTIALVNTSPETIEGADTNLYEAQLEADVGETVPFVLDALPDSFRYDRTVPAYGVNGGVIQVRIGSFRTTDVVGVSRPRPVYWDTPSAGPEPDLRFEHLALDPLPELRKLVKALRKWGDENWSEVALAPRADAEGWSLEMREQAKNEAGKFAAELGRIERGLVLLETHDHLLRAFRLANRSFSRVVSRRYDRWRPFQMGFLLSTLPSIDPDTRVADAEYVDTLWFATGGGKTETYLGLLVTAVFLDRLTGKLAGITAWARFPLRMLSLQQTQRFADILAAAELVRREEEIRGAAFSVGFLVGPATPNRIPKAPQRDDPDPTDPDMPARFQVLLRCPFCGSDQIQMRFDSVKWTLNHHCGNTKCLWKRGPLPFRIVDEEIYRLLPSVVVGTLDKAANLGLQSAMRCFYDSPLGFCPHEGHGFTYVRRSKSPSGCLVPGCEVKPKELPQPPGLFTPRIRLQDELHLLRDSLGAIDSHYEALLDHLQKRNVGRTKVVASSATLSGYEEQIEILFQREGRLFPLPGPRVGQSFWSTDSRSTARTFAGVAPRGVTLEFATDRTNETLQKAVRWALAKPESAASESGVAAASIPALASYYGVGVVYGSTLRDVEAAARSFETEIRVEPLNTVTLTGRTPFEEVRDALRRLTEPEADFDKRIHLVAASSMLSHGVDVDRLNVMVMLGLPLSTAEFIQTTSRVGRAAPGLVIVLHKINRERDAGVFRTFSSFVEHADRLVDPIPITRRSRKVLEVTFAGLFQGRLYGVHEGESIARKLWPLTTIGYVRKAFERLPVLETDELAALIDMLGAGGPLDDNIRADLAGFVRETFRALNDPATHAKWVSDIFPMGPPMRSLRDVEEQVPVYSRGGTD